MLPFEGDELFFVIVSWLWPRLRALDLYELPDETCFSFFTFFPAKLAPFGWKLFGVSLVLVDVSDMKENWDGADKIPQIFKSTDIILKN